MKRSRAASVMLGVFAAAAAVFALALLVFLTFDWNRAKPWLSERAGEALDRPFAIRGDLSLVWEMQSGARTWADRIPWPRLVARDVHIGNPPALAGSVPTEMAKVSQLAFSLSPFALLDKKIVIPDLRFDSPSLELIRDKAGRNNWSIKSGKPSAWKLELQRVTLARGSIHLTDAVKHADIRADIDTIDANSNPPNYGIAWKLRGTFNDEPISGEGKAGTVLSLQRQTDPYPIQAHLRAGPSTIFVEGTLTKPSNLAALDLRLKLSGVSMARLYALSGIVLPDTPPFSTEGRLKGNLNAEGGAHWIYENFSGKVGSSDLGGTLDFQSRQPRPLLTGTLVSRLLQFSDLAPVIGADSNESMRKRGAAVVQPPNKTLPVEPFRTDRWTSLDADIQFSVEKIIRKEQLPINKLSTKVSLKEGVLSLSRLNFDVAGGTMTSNIILDASGNEDRKGVKARITASARHLKLKSLFPSLQALQASVGEINGDASLTSAGNSVAALLGASTGEVKTLINQGTVSKLLLEEIGLNIGNVILIRLAGDRDVKLNCMAADFGVTKGVMQARSFIVDTDDATIEVSGSINLAEEKLDLTIRPQSKGVRVLSLRAPIYVRGSFKQPSVNVDKGVLATKAAGALALAAVAPLAALAPLVTAGPGEKSECATLLAAARTKPTAPPPPGKTARQAKEGSADRPQPTRPVPAYAPRFSRGRPG